MEVPKQMAQQPIRESTTSIAWPSVEQEQSLPPKPQNFNYPQQEIQNDPDRPNFNFADESRNRQSH